jgi:hypothetical protein
MNTLVLLMILAVTTFDYLTQVDLLPRVVKLVPEMVSALALLLVAFYGARNRFQFVRPAYWFIFGTLVVTIACGVVANSVEAGPLITGMRRYLRVMPLFFLPAVYAFSERQIRSQLLLLLALCLPQLPIAFSQRMATIAAQGHTGDATVGMLSKSGFLSIFLVCATCVLTAALLRKRIRPAPFLLLFILLLIPTTINETKATLILLPLGLLVTFVAASQERARLKNAVVATALLAIFGVLFVPIYDYFITQKGGPTVVEFFTESGGFARYMAKDAEIGTRSVNEVGRADAILTPLREMSRDPTHLVLGLGIGNVTDSPLGRKFEGAHFQKFAPFLKSTASILILEIGVLGLVLVLVGYYLIYRDARVVAEADKGLMGMLAAGWTGVTAVIVIATFYNNTTSSEAISYLFWYFSGLVAAHRVRLARQSMGTSAPEATNLSPHLRERPA